MDQVNIVNKLLDDLLVLIVSHLSTKDAARTSILSQRWKFLWKFTRSLEFDGRDQMEKDISNRYLSFMIDSTQHQNLEEFIQMTLNLQISINIARHHFVDLVNHVIRSHYGSTIDSFKVSFDLDEKSCKTDIDSWISFAIEKKVQKLELDLRSTSRRRDDHGRYILTTQLLLLHRVDSIRILRLKGVKVTGEVAEYALNRCHFLERLCIEYSNSLVSLKVCGTSLRLKFLEIAYCFSIQCIEIYALNLVFFKYAGPKTKVLFKNVPCLVDASVAGRFASYIANNICQFSSYLYPLETLAFDFNYCLVSNIKKVFFKLCV